MRKKIEVRVDLTREAAARIDKIRVIARLSRQEAVACVLAPVDAATLPPFTNQSGRCARCGRRGPIRVHFDRDCAAARGDHFHRVCPCGHRWVERCRE